MGAGMSVELDIAVERLCMCMQEAGYPKQRIAVPTYSKGSYAVTPFTDSMEEFFLMCQARRISGVADLQGHPSDLAYAKRFVELNYGMRHPLIERLRKWIIEQELSTDSLKVVGSSRGERRLIQARSWQ
jgi:hypothetical protein